MGAQTEASIGQKWHPFSAVAQLLCVWWVFGHPKIQVRVSDTPHVTILVYLNVTCNLLVRSNFVSCVVIRSRHRQTALASLANCCLGLAPVAFLSQIIRCTVVYSFTALILVLALSLCLHCSLGLDILIMLSTWLNRGHFEGERVGTPFPL